MVFPVLLGVKSVPRQIAAQSEFELTMSQIWLFFRTLPLTSLIVFELGRRAILLSRRQGSLSFLAWQAYFLVLVVSM